MAIWIQMLKTACLKDVSKGSLKVFEVWQKSLWASNNVNIDQL